MTLGKFIKMPHSVLAQVVVLVSQSAGFSLVTFPFATIIVPSPFTAVVDPTEHCFFSASIVLLLAQPVCTLALKM